MAVYTLKDKLEINNEFITDLITKSWQETETLQHQIANIDTTTVLGKEVVRLLKNLSTNYYVLIGCLETLTDSEETYASVPEEVSKTTIKEPEIVLQPDTAAIESESVPDAITLVDEPDFEPFEYFVDFDEPTGLPLTDVDIYGK